MNEPTLVIMAAGMGSRYGGLKQLETLGPNDEVILDYSLMDAKKAGFKKAVFIIKEAIKDDFIEVFFNRASKVMDVELAYQEVDKIPDNFTIFEKRDKPWGTAHAVLCAKDQIGGPFMVINADDYYGEDAFKTMYNYLVKSTNNTTSMVGYQLVNTLSENGTVSRGVCQVNRANHLVKITEISNLQEHNGDIGYFDNNDAWYSIPAHTTVSMNCWGFSLDFLDKLEKAFPKYLRQVLKENPVKGEVYLPSMVQELILNKNNKVDVLSTDEKWFGITYPQDKPTVEAALQKFHDEGKY